MPIVKSTYQPPCWMRSGDLMTIYMAKCRKVKGVSYQRERLELPDGDFIDLDWSRAQKPSQRCIIMLHGLEGSSKSQYMLGLAKKFNAYGFDACAVNFRGCSGQPNRMFGCYHSGKTDDVETIIQHILQQKKYKQLVLHGVSLGANVLLKYLGEKEKIPSEIKVGIAVSAPCDLAGSADKLLLKRNFLYAYNFQTQLIKKVKQKQKQFPDKLDKETIAKMKSIVDFDNLYTAPAHGFKNAEDYYAKSSSLQFLKNIQIPTLILNAQNDSFLSEESYPYQIAQNHDCIFLETPKFGGHVAFWQKGEFNYNELRAMEFVQQYL